MPNEMILTVPFSRVVKHVLKGKRSPIDFHVLDETRVAIPDLTSEEAPTGLRYVPEDWHLEKQPADHPWWDGRLWEPWSRVPSGAKHRPMTVSELLAVLEGSRDGRENYYSPFSVHPSKPYDKPFIAPDALPPGKTTDGGGREELVAKIARRASEIVLVDGKVYVPAVEPVYKVTHDSGWGRERNSDEPVLYLKTIEAQKVSAHTRPGDYWRVDRLDDAIEDLLEAENRRRGHHGHAPLSRDEIIEKCVWNRVEVLIPECVRFRYDMRPRVDHEVESAFEGLQKGLPEADMEYFATYAAFRTLVRAQPRDYEAIVAALKDGVSAALRRADREHLADRIDTLIEEWVNRDDPASVADADLAGLEVG
jgi:hypothetical protein